MQLIKNTEVRSAIANYWRRTSRIHEIIERYSSADGDLAYAIFNRSYEHMSLDGKTGLSIVSIDPKATLMSKEKNDLLNYANRTKRKVTIVNNFLIPHLNDQKKAGIELIDLIKKEYHF
jgi:hypothetical protein